MIHVKDLLSKDFFVGAALTNDAAEIRAAGEFDQSKEYRACC